MTRALSLGFVAAAAFNIVGTLVSTRGLTNEVLFSVDPELFSRGGCLTILLWGCAYLTLVRDAPNAPWVSLAFALEKLFYAFWWLRWMSMHAGELMAIRARDAAAGVFFATYGVGDGLCALFFFYVFWKYRK